MTNYKYNNTQLLHTLCSIHAPSGSEEPMKNFIKTYVAKNGANWKSPPQVIDGPDFQDCIMLKFGNPRTAVFAHMDSIGFTVRYHNQLIAIGGPAVKDGQILVGEDALGPVECTLQVKEDGQLSYDFGRNILTGTTLTYKCNFKVTDSYISSCYMDNRLGIFNALMLAEEITNGLLVFSCYEEHGGGSVPFLVKHMVEEYNVRKALISDITWVTDGIKPGEGAAISLRDRNIPRKVFLDQLLALAATSDIPYQLEVEGIGSSDGREVHHAPYAVDWCFIGAPEQHVHSPEEKVHRKDIDAMIDLYKYLLGRL